MMGRYAALIGGVAWDDGVMSQFSARPALSPRGGVMPRGDEVASFASYAEALHAVDSLSDDGFPVQHLTIIGTDLRQVERITGRMSWGRAVASGAGSGLWIGLFFGAMMSLVGSESAGGMSMVTAVLLGVVWGIVFQVGSYALTRGRRDFTSVSQVVASRYSIIASSRAAEAAQALAGVPGNLSRGGDAARRAEERRAAREQARGGGPTAFGSRLDERPRYGVRVPEGVDPSEYSDAGGPGGPGGSGAAEGEEVDPYLRPADDRGPRARGEEGSGRSDEHGADEA